MKVILIIATVVLATVYIIINSTGPTRETIVKIGQTKIKVEIVDTPAALGRGLSGRTSLRADQGMLFFFANADKWGIWMKDMRFALDIIWLDEQKKIIYIEQNVSPETYPNVFTPPVPAKYVLEVKAGWVMLNAIQLDSKVEF